MVIKVIISNDKFIAIYTMKKKLGLDLVFLIFTDKNLASNKNLVLRKKIAENMINILIFNWQGIFSNTYYTKIAFQTP